MTPWGRGELMALAAVRYCMGRMTYIVGDCADWLVEQWPNFSAKTRELIQRDVEEAIKRDDEDRAEGKPYHHLGWDCDRASWERVRQLWSKT